MATPTMQSVGRGQIPVRACGRVIGIEDTTSLADIEATLQVKLELEGRSFNIFDSVGDAIETDEALIEVIRAKRMPLAARLTELPIQVDCGGEAKTIQYRLLGDQVQATTQRMTALSKQVNEHNALIRSQRGEVEKVIERIKAELLQVVERTKEEYQLEVQALRREHEHFREQSLMSVQSLTDQIGLAAKGQSSLMQALRRDQEAVGLNLVEKKAEGKATLDQDSIRQLRRAIDEVTSKVDSQGKQLVNLQSESTNMSSLTGQLERLSAKIEETHSAQQSALSTLQLMSQAGAKLGEVQELIRVTQRSIHELGKSQDPMTPEQEKVLLRTPGSSRQRDESPDLQPTKVSVGVDPERKKLDMGRQTPESDGTAKAKKIYSPTQDLGRLSSATAVVLRRTSASEGLHVKPSTEDATTARRQTSGGRVLSSSPTRHTQSTVWEQRWAEMSAGGQRTPSFSELVDRKEGSLNTYICHDSTNVASSSSRTELTEPSAQRSRSMDQMRGSSQPTVLSAERRDSQASLSSTSWRSLATTNSGLLHQQSQSRSLLVPVLYNRQGSPPGPPQRATVGGSLMTPTPRTASGPKLLATTQQPLSQSQ